MGWGGGGGVFYHVFPGCLGGEGRKGGGGVVNASAHDELEKALKIVKGNTPIVVSVSIQPDLRCRCWSPPSLCILTTLSL